jgi:hypothetical protein
VDPDPYKQNQYGGTVGGRSARTSSLLAPSGPTARSPPDAHPAGHAGSEGRRLHADGKIIIDPQTGQPFPDNIIPSSRIDPISAKLPKYYPNPTTARRSFWNPPAGRDDYQWVGKADYYLGSKDVISSRFYDNDTFDRDENTVPGFLAHNTSTTTF